jgi:hypothetical protein
MKNCLIAATALWILVLVITSSAPCRAQALPDTSLNKVVPDTLADRKAADLEKRTRIVAATAPVRADTATGKQPFQPNPKKSALYAAILPGSGQLYNRQYWKVPVVYALTGVAVYFLVDNTKQYRNYRKSYVSRLTNPYYEDERTLPYEGYDESIVLSNLQQQQNYYKKNLDLTYLLTGVGYVLQVVDALAFAHLKNFDVSPDISMRAAPIAAPNGGMGLGLVVNWR